MSLQQNLAFVIAATIHPLNRLALLILFTSLLTPASAQQQLSGQKFSNDIENEQQYLTALHAADSLTFSGEFECEFRLLLDPQQTRSYDSLQTLFERKSYIIWYWKACDPNPLLVTNDRLTDHLRRRRYARLNFPHTRPPYFDDRGKYFIKYGKPSARYCDPGGMRRISFFNPVTYPHVQGLYPFKQAPEEFYMAAENETWAYENIGRDFVVHFKRHGQVFREIHSLTEVLTSRLHKNLAWSWGDLVKQRAGVSPVMARASQEVERFEMSLLHASAAHRRGELQLPNDHLMAIAAQNEHEASEANLVMPPSAHEPIKAINRLQFKENIAQFRASHGKTRVEITVLAPLEKNLANRVASTANDVIDLDFAWMLRDMNLDSLAAQHRHVEFPLQLAAIENLPNAVGYFSLVSPPQEVELSLQVQDLAAGNLGFSRQPFVVRDFNNTALLLSDMQFYLEVKNEKQRRVLPELNKQNLALAPYPYAEVRKSLPLYCYFEIYNLHAAGLTENYEITYEIISEAGQSGLLKKISRWLSGTQKPAISLSHEQAATDDSAQELFAVDLSNLSNGGYRFKISIRNAKNNAIVASVERAIVIED